MVRLNIEITSILLLTLCFLSFSGKIKAQEIIEDLSMDTVLVMPPDSLTEAVIIAADSAFVSLPEVPKAAFKPNSTKAILFGLIPGMGQIYNRKYWKLPLVYGGFMGFMYAITWNNKNYQDYWGAYRSIMQDANAFNKLIEEAENPDQVQYNFSEDWTIWVVPGTERTQVNDKNLQDQFRRRKDYFRRYRDLSIILAVGFYAITLIDAYVDAELFDFDISPDLSMRVEPVYSPQTRYSSRTIGLNCSITF